MDNSGKTNSKEKEYFIL